MGTADWLMTLEAIRSRCSMVYDAGVNDELRHFKLNFDRLDELTDYVFKVTKDNYPNLQIPYHARWRHFVLKGDNLWEKISCTLTGDSEERARVAFDLIITSVLLDAGAGEHWQYQDPESGVILNRSEGLAVASINAFKKGLFSSDPKQPFRADAAALQSITIDSLGAAFQVTSSNQLASLDGRSKLMNELGAVIREQPQLFGQTNHRIGCLFDYLKTQVIDNKLDVQKIFSAITHGLGEIWPGRLSLDGINLGDTWHHSAVCVNGPSNRFVPLHKLSQWITFSLIEPLEEAGIEVVGSEHFTALAEYRNGGLLLDSGVLSPKYNGITNKIYLPGDEVIVEWRALTVILIDKVAERLRSILNLDAKTLPLAKVLEGGTWSAGRKIALSKRSSGGTPIQILSDGSVF